MSPRRILIFGILLISHFSLRGAQIECTSYTSLQRFTDICFGAVDYNYYVPPGFSNAFLNSKAKLLLNSTYISILPVPCQISIKRLVCSGIYLKCFPGGANVRIYSDIYGQLDQVSQLYPSILSSPYIPLPYERPCLSVCEDVKKNCFGALELLGMNLNCSARLDYSFGALNDLYALVPALPLPYQYDGSNDTRYCNSMPAKFDIASSQEPYQKANDPTGFCYGIIQDVYIPPSQVFDSSLAPLLPPYVLQSLIEQRLSSSFARLPVWMTKNCAFALKKYICTSAYLHPFAQTVQSDIVAALEGSGLTLNASTALVRRLLSPNLLENRFYLPSYPSRSVCKSYAESCATFIDVAQLPELEHNCSAVTHNGAIPLELFPAANQTIASLSLSLSLTPRLTVDLAFRTPPYTPTVPLQAFDYSPLCPAGYVIPNKDDPRTIWIPGTACALSCRPPVWTTSQWKSLAFLNLVIAWIGLPMVCFFLLTWLSDPERRKQYLIISFATYSMLVTLLILPVAMIPFESAFCATNAVPLDQTDGVNICTLQSFLLPLGGVGAGSSWLCLSLDLYLKVVRGYRHTGHLRPYYFTFIILVSSAFTLSILGFKYSFTQALPFCFVESGSEGNLIAFFLPVLIITIVGVLLLSQVIYTFVKRFLEHSPEETENPVTRRRRFHEKLHRLRPLRKPLMFMSFAVVLILTFEVYRFMQNHSNQVIERTLPTFTTCVFEHFDGTEESWTKRCGLRPAGMSYSFNVWTYICIVGQSILVSLIYVLTPKVYSYWKHRVSLIGYRQTVIRQMRLPGMAAPTSRFRLLVCLNSNKNNSVPRSSVSAHVRRVYEPDGHSVKVAPAPVGESKTDHTR